jgi:hypothetical protein
MLRGNYDLFTSVSIEALVGSRDWFSQALGPNHFGAIAIGQAALSGKGARLNWLLSTQKTGSDPLPELIEHISLEAGTRGARFISAGAKVDDCLFEILRRAGFCVYGWQSIWKLDNFPSISPYNCLYKWRLSSEKDLPAIEALQRKLLAPAVQSVTEFASTRQPKYLLEGDGEVQGFAYIERSNNLATIKPFLRMETENVEALLNQLAGVFLPGASSIFLIQTSDQAWLTQTLLAMGSQVLPREELLVKHFAVMEKLPVAGLNTAHNGRQTDTIRPLIPTSDHGDH